MKLNAYCDFYTDNSYFLFNKNNQITSFNIQSTEKIGHFISRYPEIGESFVEIIAQKFEKSFSRMVGKCFKGKSFNIEKRLKIKGEEDVLLQVVLTPVLDDPENPYVACTIIDSNRKSNQMKLLDEYTYLASHGLRAPITNILSLSSLLNFPDMGSFDTAEIKGLLTDINDQAEKLDGIIQMLNRMVNHGQQQRDFIPEPTIVKPKHIMLVDDDSLTNKLHHMMITRHNKNKLVVQFDHPVQALEYLEINRPDLILLDLNMPEIDGWAFLKLMEERDILVDVVIISSTIDPAEKTRAQSYKQVKDFLTKPLSYDKIKHLVDN
jgi:CheY-like chemotaxis protein